MRQVFPAGARKNRVPNRRVILVLLALAVPWIFVPPAFADETIYLDNRSRTITITGDVLGGLTRYTDFGGEDVYTISTDITGDVEVIDNQFSTIILPEGLMIQNPRFSADGVYWVVNGHDVTLLGQPSSFDYVFAGNAENTSLGIHRNFTETAAVFGAEIPTVGAPPVDGMISGTIGANGDIIGADNNQAPTASARSIQIDVNVPYIELALSGSDPDGDTLSFVLDSPATGLGYTEAYVSPQSGRLYVTLDGSGVDLNLDYRVSDGILYSEPASIVIDVVDEVDEESGTGLEFVDAQTYGTFSLVNPYGDLFGAPGDGPRLPTAVDLSAQFPMPGNQGHQGSCVGWATAYALKSYHERVEIGWDLDRPEHIFSPAFVYNQIKIGSCADGSRFKDALDLLQSVGVSTLDTMPYDDSNCSRQPSAAASAEAGDFLIASWGRLQTNQEIKAELANSKPVLAGIDVYSSLNRLSGSNSVYSPNIDFEPYEGGHAVTIVGYDDSRHGGAFRVINSWGRNFGDNGYFWLPYDVSGRIVREAYSVSDAENTLIPEPIEPRPSPAALPNLQVESWSADYHARPGGGGTLEWRVTNVGTEDAPTGVRVAFMLSKNATFSTSDTLVIYDEIPFALEAGHSAYRDEDNNIEFAFPDTLIAGEYYMAVWVDDLDLVNESNENDNISLGSDQVDIVNQLADLVIKSWYAEWNAASGDGTFYYEVANQGRSAAASGWDINLMLSRDQVLGNSGDRYLFYEDVPFALEANRSVWRDESNPGFFNLFASQEGNQVEAGTYYMAVWADDLNEVEESNERNNISWGRDTIRVGGGFKYTSERTSDKAEPTLIVQEFNGKQLPNPEALVRRVEVRTKADGGLEMIWLDEEPQLGNVQSEAIYPKTNHAATLGIFPAAGERPMP